MRISPVQNYNYANSKNLNSTTKQSSSFGELHFSPELREFFRVKNIPLEPLKTVKNNTKVLSENMLRGCIKYMQKYICDKDSQASKVIDICRDVSQKKYGLENKKIMSFAKSEQVAKICKNYADKVAKEAWEIFTKYGKDFHFEVSDENDNKKTWERSCHRIYYYVPGLSGIHEDYNGYKTEYFKNIQDHMEYLSSISKNSISWIGSPRLLPDTASDIAKDLVVTFELIKEDFQNAVREQISTMAEQIVQNDNYETLK